jgi:hypothetical protein
MEDGEISNNGLSTITGPYALNTSYQISNGVVYVILGGGVFITTSGKFIMTGGKILDNGDNDVFSHGIFRVGGAASVTLDGPVEIRGNSINAFTASTAIRNPIIVGENFVNLGVDPIVVDLIGDSSRVTSSGLLRTYFNTAPAQPIVSDVTKLDYFTTGKAGIATTENFTIYTNSYTINDTTGLITSIP